MCFKTRICFDNNTDSQMLADVCNCRGMPAQAPAKAHACSNADSCVCGRMHALRQARSAGSIRPAWYVACVRGVRACVHLHVLVCMCAWRGVVWMRGVRAWHAWHAWRACVRACVHRTAGARVSSRAGVFLERCLLHFCPLAFFALMLLVCIPWRCSFSNLKNEEKKWVIHKG